MRFLTLSLASVLALSVVAVPAAEALSMSTFKASIMTKYELRAALKAKKTKRPASVELPAVAKGGLIFGDAEATTTIVMFTDIQCPFCKRFTKDTYPSLKKDYLDTGKVRFVIKHFPLSFHGQALPAAKAVVCAREQGDDKARTLYDKLIATKELTAKTLSSSIGAVEGLDAGMLTKCVTAEKTQKTIDSDLKTGSEASVFGTPGFFIVGPTGASQQISGAYPLETFTKAIDAVQKK